MLTFLGIGSAFFSENNSAFYAQNGNLILLDCPKSAFQSIVSIGADKLTGTKTEKITVLVTHTHSDHIGGVGMLVHYCYYVSGIHVDVIVPNEAVADDMRFFLKRLDGCHPDGYSIIRADELDDKRFVPVPTEHSPELAGRCYGWCLDIDGRRAVFTGDTNTIEPFLPYLESGTYLYTEMAAIKNPVHLWIEDLRGVVTELINKGVKVYFMHLDDEEALKKAASELGAEIAPLYNCN